MHFYQIELRCLDIDESKKFYCHLFDFINSKKIPLAYSEEMLRIEMGDYGDVVVFWGNAVAIPSIRIVEIEKVKIVLPPEYRIGIQKFSLNLISRKLLDDLHDYLSQTMHVEKVKESEFIKGLWAFSVQDPSGALVEFVSFPQD